jgi:hypothetical protein
MLQANNCKLLRGWGVAKPLDGIGQHRIIGRRPALVTPFNSFLPHQFSSHFIVASLSADDRRCNGARTRFRVL